MAALSSLTFGVLALSGAWNALGLASVVSARRGRGEAARPGDPREELAGEPLEAPPVAGGVGVSIVRPLAGADPELERCLESSFTQDFPLFEVVLGVERGDDPAIAVAERVRARYPAVPSRIVVHGRAHGLNPKVRNLLGTLPHTSFDLVVACDSNVVTPREHARDLVATRARERAGLVTSLVAGVGERGVGGALESVQLNGFTAAGSCLPTLLGDALVVGKVMLFAQTELRELGGLDRVADLLAEDFVLGKTFQHAGGRVVVGRVAVENPTSGTTLARFLERQTRWAVLRWRLRPVAFLVEPLASPLVAATLGAATLGVAALPWLTAWAMACWALAARDFQPRFRPILSVAPTIPPSLPHPSTPVNPPHRPRSSCARPEPWNTRLHTRTSAPRARRGARPGQPGSSPLTQTRA
ncbi:MAG: glycosyltransferase [Polyangiaceae bacterium]|nr:glycosyltransferase [Polyangiaceae bacterium]